MDTIEWLERIDKVLFLIIHQDSDAAVFDHIMPVLRSASTWIPLYFFMLFFAWRNIHNKTVLFVVLSIVTVILCDRLSAGLFKPLFSRARPCFDSELQPLIRNLIDCGGRYSFPSSHAANHFGLACFWFLTIKAATGQSWHWLWIWALCIAYAQVYVGKHYPLDVAAGALLGVLVGTATAKIFEYWHLSKKFRLVFPIQTNSLEN